MHFTRFLIRVGFLYNYFEAGEDNKAVFSFPGDTLMVYPDECVYCILNALHEEMNKKYHHLQFFR